MVVQTIRTNHDTYEVCRTPRGKYLIWSVESEKIAYRNLTADQLQAKVRQLRGEPTREQPCK